MNELDISFEDSPWERYFLTKGRGTAVSAADFLAMLEGEGEDYVEDALAEMEERGVTLEVSSLPKTMGAGEGAARMRLECQLAKQGMDPRELEKNDPLRLYLEEVAAIPAFGEEGQLAQQCARGEQSAMERLTNLGLSRVIEIAAEHVGYGVLLLDLIQEGSLGLWQAVQSYREGDYGAHRDRFVRFYMAKAVTLQARANGVGQKMRQALEDYRAVDERLLGELGRNPTLEEIALELHMGPEEAAVVRNMMENAKTLAMARPEEKPEQEQEKEENQAVEDTAYFQMRRRIGELLSLLSPEDAQLLSLRFGLEGGLPLSPEDTGRRLGLTTREVLYREAAALAKLRRE